MARHKFKVGDRVTLSASRMNRSGTIFKVTRLLPGEREDLPPQYRVKADSETYERVAEQDAMEVVKPS